MSQERYDPKDPKFEAMPVISIKHTEKTLLEIGHESIDTVYRCVKAICSEYEKTKELALKTLLEMKLKELGYEVEIDGDELLKAVAKATPRKPNNDNCPNCGKHLGIDGLTIKSDFCPHCGQRLDWKEEKK